MDHQIFSKQYFSTLNDILENIDLLNWSAILDELEAAFLKDVTIYLIGNGGSASTAAHMANDLMLGVAKAGGTGFRAISLCDNAAVTMAIANDTDFGQIFSQQLQVLANPGDVLLAISGSGNSPNLVQAVKAANDLGMVTIGWLGMGGGKLHQMCDFSLVVPSDNYGLIETVHMALDHLLVDHMKQFQQENDLLDHFRKGRNVIVASDKSGRKKDVLTIQQA
jgi:D-sedoheptulose 7-phosphate isomerase